MNNGRITISRPTCGNGDEYISITIKDSTSKERFLDIRVSYEDFAKALTGLSEVECNIITRNLDRVGKKKESMEIVFKLREYREMENLNGTVEALAYAATPEGWEPSLYFGSKNSFFEEDGAYWARTTANRWVEEGSI